MSDRRYGHEYPPCSECCYWLNGVCYLIPAFDGSGPPRAVAEDEHCEMWTSAVECPRVTPDEAKTYGEVAP